jgi:hypothetical protein
LDILFVTCCKDDFIYEKKRPNSGSADNSLAAINVEWILSGNAKCWRIQDVGSFGELLSSHPAIRHKCLMPMPSLLIGPMFALGPGIENLSITELMDACPTLRKILTGMMLIVTLLAN